MSSIYERIGGEAAIDAAVDLFYKKVLADDRIKHFFVGIPMERQHDHQKKFLTVALGGPNNYSGRGMKAAHSRLVNEMGLNDGHFDAVMENLGATLVDLGVPADLIGEAAAVAESTREQVLGRA
ncbi:group I truncated hemoglobin [Coraliomargarita parva]|uniref:group I truncated hemoglobin n=1 Tax=Coraliomargarita parva TaxID=3014050 RepID=UPI0022B5BBB2|nr:group 1 truncated hemoglobin [Coraliomargarita parva]